MQLRTAHTPARPAAPGPVADRRSEHGGYTSTMQREHGFEPMRVEGRVPERLRGTLVRNGPAQLELFGAPYAHPFEGDGALAAVRFEQGQVLGAHRLVRSAGLQAEERAGRPLYQSNARPLSRSWRSLRRRTKNSANTSAMVWQGRLLALFEAGLPTELSLRDLSTHGTRTLGVIEQAFSAHPHRVASRRASYNFGQRIGPRTYLDIYALPDVGNPKKLTSVRLDKPVMLHDFVATDSHLIFFVAPARLRLARALFGVGAFSDYFRWTPSDGTEVIVVPIDRPRDVVRFRTDAFWQWHFTNAFERGAELVVDFIRYDDLGSLDVLAQPGAPVEQGLASRAVIDPSRRTIRIERISDVRCEFPTIDPRTAGAPTQTAWISCDGARAAIGTLDLESGATRLFEMPEGQRPSEALYVPDDEGPGWALSLVWDAATNESHVAIFDAAQPEAGPIAKAFYGHHVPVTYHGIFVPEPS